MSSKSESSAPAHPPAKDHDDTVEAHYSGLERLESPHACNDGVVYVGHLVEDPGTGDRKIIGISRKKPLALKIHREFIGRWY